MLSPHETTAHAAHDEAALTTYKLLWRDSRDHVRIKLRVGVGVGMGPISPGQASKP